ncbi:MAG TPA: hypothetical protein P5138_10850, partial [Solirubrobacterales bacterium]|nr:hypothetical protein [Solirubrobacterales bacterium]
MVVPFGIVCCASGKFDGAGGGRDHPWSINRQGANEPVPAQVTRLKGRIVTVGEDLDTICEFRVADVLEAGSVLVAPEAREPGRRTALP